MTYFRELRDDIRRIITDRYELLVIAMVASLAITASYYHHIRIRALQSDLRAAIEVLGRGLIFFIPTLFSALILKIPLRELGFDWGVPRKWLRDVLLLYIIMLPVLWFAARQPDFRNAYPYMKLARNGWEMFLLAQAIQLAFMFSWEFVCRGYLLFGFFRHIGNAAVAVSVIPFVLLHIGKPELEAYGSALAGIALAIIALRAKSFYPAVLLHFLVAATLDLLAVIRR